MASGDGKFPINTRLLGTGDGAAPITAVFAQTQPSGKDIEDANTDFFFGVSGVSGTLSKTLDAITLSGSATVDIAGLASQTLGALTTSATGAVDIAASASVALGPLVLTAAGAVDVVGTSTVSLGPLTVSAASTLQIQASLSPTLDSLTSASASTNDIAATTTAALFALTAGATGTIDVSASADITLGSVVSSTLGESETAVVRHSGGSAIIFYHEKEDSEEKPRRELRLTEDDIRGRQTPRTSLPAPLKVLPPAPREPIFDEPTLHSAVTPFASAPPPVAFRGTRIQIPTAEQIDAAVAAKQARNRGSRLRLLLLAA